MKKPTIDKIPFTELFKMSGERAGEPSPKSLRRTLKIYWNCIKRGWVFPTLKWQVVQINGQPMLMLCRYKFPNMIYRRYYFISGMVEEKSVGLGTKTDRLIQLGIEEACNNGNHSDKHII